MKSSIKLVKRETRYLGTSDRAIFTAGSRRKWQLYLQEDGSLIINSACIGTKIKVTYPYKGYSGHVRLHIKDKPGTEA